MTVLSQTPDDAYTSVKRLGERVDGRAETSRTSDWTWTGGGPTNGPNEWTDEWTNEWTPPMNGRNVWTNEWTKCGGVRVDVVDWRTDSAAGYAVDHEEDFPAGRDDGGVEGVQPLHAAGRHRRFGPQRSVGSEALGRRPTVSRHVVDPVAHHAPQRDPRGASSASTHLVARAPGSQRRLPGGVPPLSLHSFVRSFVTV